MPGTRERQFCARMKWTHGLSRCSTSYWPKESFERSSRLPTVQCPACDDGHWEETEWIDGGAFIGCPEFGKTPVPFDRLRRWTVSADGIAALAARRLKARTVDELVAGRIWKLTRIHAGGHPWLPLVVRGIGWSDRAGVIDGVIGPLLIGPNAGIHARQTIRIWFRSKHRAGRAALVG